LNAKSFIKKYENFLPEEKKENAVKFGNGSLSFSKAEYEEAVFYLSNHSLDRSFFDIRAKFLLIKALYEISHSSNEASIKRLQNAIEAFLKYIERKKIGEEKKIFYQNFAKYIRGIVKDKIRNLPLKELSKKWTNKIQHEDKIYGKVWLLKKVNLKNLKKKILPKE
jgi:hypothetical protein